MSVDMSPKWFWRVFFTTTLALPLYILLKHAVPPPTPPYVAAYLSAAHWVLSGLSVALLVFCSIYLVLWVLHLFFGSGERTTMSVALSKDTSDEQLAELRRENAQLKRELAETQDGLDQWRHWYDGHVDGPDIGRGEKAARRSTPTPQSPPQPPNDRVNRLFGDDPVNGN